MSYPMSYLIPPMSYPMSYLIPPMSYQPWSYLIPYLSRSLKKGRLYEKRCHHHP